MVTNNCLDRLRPTFARTKQDTNEFKNICEALTWAEPESKNNRKVDRMTSEYKDMFLRDALYWEQADREKENAK